MRSDISAAIEVAAGADDQSQFRTVGAATVPSERKIAHTQNVVLRFLQSLEDESMSVAEVRRELED